jgi:hypothetical protein
MRGAHSPSGSETRTLGYGPDEDNEIVNIFEHGDEAHTPGRGCHIAFNASSRNIVLAFYEAAGYSEWGNMQRQAWIAGTTTVKPILLPSLLTLMDGG